MHSWLWQVSVSGSSGKFDTDSNPTILEKSIGHRKSKSGFIVEMQLHNFYNLQTQLRKVKHNIYQNYREKNHAIDRVNRACP